MKKVLFLIIALTSCLSVSAQDYKNILTEGKRWKVLVRHWPHEDMYLDFRVSGDTIVDGRNCKRITNDQGTTHTFAAYEEDRKLYYMDSGKPSLLLDMAVKTGDDVLGYGEGGNTTVDEITVKGVNRKRIVIESPGNETVCWVEGIGSNIDKWIYGPEKVIGMTSYLIECYDNDELIFSQSDFGVTLGVNAATQDRKKDGTMYSISGMKLKEAPANGMYIMDGKKVAK